MAQFYTYQYLRTDGSPHYVGKGSNGRVYADHKGHHPPKSSDGSIDHSRILIQHWPDEATALAYERYIIDFWGRKDIDTGILRNRTDGGENPPSNKGKPHSEEHRKKIGQAHKGNKYAQGRKCSAETRQILSDLAKTRMNGPNNPFRGTKYSQERVQKSANGRRGKKRLTPAWNKGKTGIFSPETLQLMSRTRTGRASPNKGKHISHCKRGHERTSENVDKAGGCKTCKRIGEQARQAILPHRPARHGASGRVERNQDLWQQPQLPQTNSSPMALIPTPTQA